MFKKTIGIFILLTLTSCSGGGGTSGGSSTPSNNGGGSSYIAPPTGVIAAPGHQQNTITWQASNALFYEVYWSTTPGVTKNNGTRVPGSVRHSGATASIVHTNLNNGTTYYYIVIATDFSNISSPSQEVSATPRLPTPVKGWSIPFDASLQHSYLNMTQTVTDSVISDNGIGFVLWLEDTGSPNKSLYVNKYFSATFATPILIDRGTSYESIHLLPNGDAVVVYLIRGTLATSTIYARRYSHLTNSWSPREIISSTTSNLLSSVKAATDSLGNIMVIWDREMAANRLSAKYYNSTLKTWGASTAIDAGNFSASSFVKNFELVVDGNNVFTAIWDELKPGTSKNLAYARSFTSAAGWALTPQLISWPANALLGPLDSTGHLNANTNAAGDILVTWEQTRSNARSLATAYYDSAVGQWGTPTDLGAIAGRVLAKPMVSGNGNATIVWQTTMSPTATVYSFFATSLNKISKTWSTPQNIYTCNPVNTPNIQAGMDAAGNIRLVWLDDAVYINRMSYELYFDNTNATGWAPRRTLAIAKPLQSHAVDVSDNGYAIIAINDVPYLGGTTILTTVKAMVFTP